MLPQLTDQWVTIQIPLLLPSRLTQSQLKQMLDALDEPIQTTGHGTAYIRCHMSADSLHNKFRDCSKVSGPFNKKRRASSSPSVLQLLFGKLITVLFLISSISTVPMSVGNSTVHRCIPFEMVIMSTAWQANGWSCCSSDDV
ncbi:hypothetical protein D3C74_37550 [compost metagenome]